MSTDGNASKRPLESPDEAQNCPQRPRTVEKTIVMTAPEISNLIRAVMREEQAHLATKEDMDRLGRDLNLLKKENLQLKTDLNQIKTDLTNLKMDHQKLERKIKERNMIAFVQSREGEDPVDVVQSGLSRLRPEGPQVQRESIRTIKKNPRGTMLLVEMASSGEVEGFLRRSRTLKGTHLFIQRDLCQEQIKVRNELLHIRKLAKTYGKNIFVKTNSFVIEGVEYKCLGDQPGEQPDDSKSIFDVIPEIRENIPENHNVNKLWFRKYKQFGKFSQDANLAKGN